MTKLCDFVMVIRYMSKPVRDLEGQRFDRLIALKLVPNPVPTRKRNGAYWQCKCDCGNIVTRSGLNLVRKNTRSCGCLSQERRWSRLIDLSGKRFGRMTALKRAPNRGNDTMWQCRCDCGSIRIVGAPSLVSGSTKSCGCLRSDMARAKKQKAKGENGFNFLYHVYKANAAKKSLDFTLTKEKFHCLTKLDCSYCGRPPQQLSLSIYNNSLTPKGLDHAQYLYNGLDRIDPQKGYSEQNVVPCCKTCNYAKRKMTIEEFKGWIAQVYNFFVIKT